MAQGVVLGCALRVHDDDVIGVLETAGERLGAPAQIEAFVIGQRVDRLRANRMERITLRPRDRHAEHEGLALLDRADAAQNLLVGEEVETPKLVVRAPTSPILRRILEQFGEFDWSVRHGISSSVICENDGYLSAGVLVGLDGSVKRAETNKSHAVQG